jgi:hypothetical protein
VFVLGRPFKPSLMPIGQGVADIHRNLNCQKVIHLIVKIANANNDNNNKNENNNNNNDNNNNNVHEQTFLKLNKFTNMYGMMFTGVGRDFPDFSDYPDYLENPEETETDPVFRPT